MRRCSTLGCAPSTSSVPREMRACGGRLRGRAPAMSSTQSDVGFRTARARRSSTITAPALRVSDMDVKRPSSPCCDALGCRMKPVAAASAAIAPQRSRSSRDGLGKKTDGCARCHCLASDEEVVGSRLAALARGRWVRSARRFRPSSQRARSLITCPWMPVLGLHQQSSCRACALVREPPTSLPARCTELAP